MNKNRYKKIFYTVQMVLVLFTTVAQFRLYSTEVSSRGQFRERLKFRPRASVESSTVSTQRSHWVTYFEIDRNPF